MEGNDVGFGVGEGAEEQRFRPQYFSPARTHEVRKKFETGGWVVVEGLKGSKVKGLVFT